MNGLVRTGAKSFLRAYARYRPPEIDRRLTSLGAVVGRADRSLFATADLSRHEQRVFSQNGEDGVIIEIFNRIGVTNRHFVEFGIQDGTEGNAVLLADVFGWSGLFIEGDEELSGLLQRKYADTAVTCLCAMVSASNVNDLFASAGVPTEPDLVSIDIDGNDVYVWDALTEFRPRVVVIEYNSGIDEPGPVAQPHTPDRGWDGTGAFGANLAALDVVAARRGYRLAYTDLSGVNAFYVREDCWDALQVDRVPRRSQNYGLTGIRQAPAAPAGGWHPVK
ncbi:hypothetical protein ASD66_09765 [Nocardioides sp. Root151]|nr:hypothetical protein ASD66_09765 [Nocardioides sp. Root151]